MFVSLEVVYLFFQFSGPTPSACWSKIYKKMRKIQSDGLKAEARSERVFESGVDMFGFSYPEISKLIEVSKFITSLFVKF